MRWHRVRPKMRWHMYQCPGFKFSVGHALMLKLLKRVVVHLGHIKLKRLIYLCSCALRILDLCNKKRHGPLIKWLLLGFRLLFDEKKVCCSIGPSKLLKFILKKKKLLIVTLERSLHIKSQTKVTTLIG